MLDYDADVDAEPEEVFDDHLYAAASHTDTDVRLLENAQNAADTLRTFSADEFMCEAIVAATNLRNILGDADGHAYDLAEQIRTNLIVVSMALKADPAAYVIAAALTIEDPIERKNLLTDVLHKVNEHILATN